MGNLDVGGRGVDWDDFVIRHFIKNSSRKVHMLIRENTDSLQGNGSNGG